MSESKYKPKSGYDLSQIDRTLPIDKQKEMENILSL